MPRFRKRPVTVDAVQWGGVGDHPAVRPWIHPYSDVSKGVCGYCAAPMGAHGWIDTREGGHIVCPGDWVITGVAGENYPCKPDIFEQTYEAV
jgi:hypothetical protein